MFISDIFKIEHGFYDFENILSKGIKIKPTTMTTTIKQLQQENQTLEWLLATKVNNWFKERANTNNKHAIC